MQDNESAGLKSGKALFLAAAVVLLVVVSLGVLAGGGAVLPGDQTGSRNPTSLGDFESGLDGWRTGGGSNLSRVNENDVPAGVSSGRHALAVEVQGGREACPAVWNQELATNADFHDNPYVGMHVLVHAKQTDSDIKFRLRLRHGSNLVLETEPESVPQIWGRTLQWNLSDAPEEALRSADRLDVVWFLNETTSSGDDCPDGGFHDDALVVLDHIRLNTTPIITEVESWLQKKRDLHREHGMIVDREFHEMAEDYERGTWTFSDGTEIQYEYRSTPDGYRFVIDGETFEVQNNGDM